MKKRETAACVTIAGHIEQCLAGYAKRKYSPTTIRTYQSGFQRFAAFLEDAGIGRVQDVTLSHLEQYRRHLAGQNLAERTIDIWLRSVKALFNYLAENQCIFINPATQLRLPRLAKTLGNVPTRQEVQTLLAMPDQAKPGGIRDRAILEIFYSCGLRREELRGLSIFDHDLSQATLRIAGKGRKERVVPLGKHAVFWLKKYLDHARPKFALKNPDETSLWLNKDGMRMGGLRLCQIVRDYAKAAKIDKHISPHALRRACATHMLQGGAHPVQIQMLLGHSSLDNLKQYLQVTITDIRNMHKGSNPGK